MICGWWYCGWVRGCACENWRRRSEPKWSGWTSRSPWTMRSSARSSARGTSGEPVEEFHPAILAPELDDSREPGDIARLYAELALPLRIEETHIAPGQGLLAH